MKKEKFEVSKFKLLSKYDDLLAEIYDESQYQKIFKFVKEIFDLEDGNELINEAKEESYKRLFEYEIHRISAIAEFIFEIDSEVIGKHYEVFEKTSKVHCKDSKKKMEIVNKEPRYWLIDTASEMLERYLEVFAPVEDWRAEYKKNEVVPVAIKLRDGREWIEKIKVEPDWHVKFRPGWDYEIDVGSFYRHLVEILMRKYVKYHFLKISRQKKVISQGEYFFDVEWSDEEVLYPLHKKTETKMDRS